MNWNPISIQSFRVTGIRPSDRAYRVQVNLAGDLKHGWVPGFNEVAKEAGLEAEVMETDRRILVYSPHGPNGTTKQSLEYCIQAANQAFEVQAERDAEEDRLCKEYEDFLNRR